MLEMLMMLKELGNSRTKAIDKLKQATENNGIKEPKIYTIASGFHF